MNKLTPLGQTTLNFFRDSVEEGHLELFDALIDELRGKQAASQADIKQAWQNVADRPVQRKPEEPKTPAERKVIFEHVCTLDAGGHPYMHQIFNLAPGDCAIKSVGKFHGKPIRVTVYENEVKA